MLIDHWANVYRGAGVFLVGGGPSLNGMAPLLEKLQQTRGIVIAAMNQVAATHIRPQLWFGIDEARKFHPAIWRDPAIAKFFPATRSGELVGQPCPNTWFYRRRFLTPWSVDGFLKSDRPVVGGDMVLNGNRHRHRSVMLPALWILRWMGFARVYLLGVDWRYRQEEPYAFDQQKSASMCGHGNDAFAVVGRWLAEIYDAIRVSEFGVYNCTPGSHLAAFPELAMATALACERRKMPGEVKTAGMYD